MKVTALCPSCNSRIPRHIAWNASQRDVHICRQCNSLLRRHDTDRQPLTTIILVLIFTPALFAVIGAILLIPYFGIAAFLLVFLAAPFCYAISQWQFPYTNGFTLWTPKCIKCGYDMRGDLDQCPECGGPPETAPNQS